VLKGVDSGTILPIWVGAFEANAIALEIEKIVSQRPMTHDLFRNFVVEIGYKVLKIVITDLRDNTFYALIEFSDPSGTLVNLDARPSDAIALALRLDCPIFVNQKVLELTISSSKKETELFDEEMTHAEEWPDLIS
jgi:bifunctional DNase/RNase